MKYVNWKAAAIYLIGGSIIGLSSYIAGHAACAHQHVATSEQNRMLIGKRGFPDKRHYILEAFKDYKRMIQDPLATKRDWLD